MAAYIQRVVIITGASKGIGEEIANQLNEKFSENTLFVLIARSLDKLDELKRKLASKKPLNQYKTLKIDFSNEKVDYANELKNSFKELILTEVKDLLVFYNHGSLIISDVESSANDINEFFEVNVLSVWKFLSAVRELFPADKVPKQFHINTSSKLATSFSAGMSAYSSSKGFFVEVKIIFSLDITSEKCSSDFV